MIPDPIPTKVRFHQYLQCPYAIIKAMRFDHWRLLEMWHEGIITSEQYEHEMTKNVMTK